MIPTAPTPLIAYDFNEGHLGPNEPDSVDVDAFIRFIRKSWGLVFLWVFLSLCAGIAFMMLAPAYYTAYTTILLEDRASRAPADAAARDAAPDLAFADTQVEVLQSDEVVRRVIDQNRLTELEEFGKGGGLRSLLSSFGSAIEGSGKDGAGLSSPLSRFASPENTDPAAMKRESRYTAFMRVKHALSIRRLGISNVVEIGFTSRSRLRSAAIANAIAQSYIENQVEMKRQAFQDAASQLRQSLAALRNKAFAIDLPAETSSTPETGEQALARAREQQSSADAYRALYGSLYSNLLQRSYAQSGDQSSFPAARVLTPAEPPAERSWPRAILVLAIAVAGGAAGGFVHALLRQATDHSLKTVEEVQRSSNLDRVAGIPKIRWGRRSRAFRQSGLQPAYAKVFAEFHDSLGKLAVRLQGGLHQRGGVLIGVVAPMAGAGASSIAAHLARIIAESGQKTLLVDANWQKPSIEPASPEPNSSRKLAWRIATVDLKPESLDVLLLWPTAPISALNASLSIVSTVQQLKAQYDCVIVDFHAAGQTADFEANLTAVNEMIIVVEAKRASSQSFNQFLRLIPRNKIAAVVVNKV